MKKQTKKKNHPRDKPTRKEKNQILETIIKEMENLTGISFRRIGTDGSYRFALAKRSLPYVAVGYIGNHFFCLYRQSDKLNLFSKSFDALEKMKILKNFPLPSMQKSMGKRMNS